MFVSLNDIAGFKIRTHEGDFGEVKAFLIDDFNWIVRYLIVDIDDRHVLLSPLAVTGLTAGEGVVDVNVDLETVLNSPRVDLDQDLSRELERQLSDYYHWPYYWEPTEYPTSLPGDLTAVPLIDMELDRQQEEEELIPETGDRAASPGDARNSDFHLRSTHEIFGYHLFGENDQRDAGKLSDIVIGDEDWQILYLVVETGGMLSNRKVLVSPNWVKQVDEDERRVIVDLKEETIRESPEFNASTDLTPDFQAQLKKYYGEQ